MEYDDEVDEVDEADDVDEDEDVEDDRDSDDDDDVTDDTSSSPPLSSLEGRSVALDRSRSRDTLALTVAARGCCPGMALRGGSTRPAVLEVLLDLTTEVSKSLSSGKVYSQTIQRKPVLCIQNSQANPLLSLNEV